ncbi:MAG: dienelactone hydrolase family protein [Burkholderiales bacterium]
MSSRIAPALACLALAASAAVQGALPAPARVTFPSLDRDASGDPVTISALYFRPPQAAPGAAVPLIVAAHGCGGMFSANRERRDQLSERFAAWTEQFLADGYAVLWPDSFNPRGRRSVCLARRGEPTVAPATRRLDIMGALAYAAAEPGVDHARVALVGWSHGGSTALAASNGRDAQVAALLAAPGASPALRAAVALYPGCVVSLRQGANWVPAVPLALHVGELDDWTPPGACVRLGDSARARGASMTVTVYPGAYHGFDAPSGKVTLWKDVTTGANPDRGVHLGPDPAARAATIEAVRAFLRERLAAAAPR